VKVSAIDLELMGMPGVVGAYLIPSEAGHVLVDCGPGATIQKLYAGVSSLGFDPKDIKHLLLTHIHLDHAGAAGQLARELGLRVYVHKHGSSHMLRPERLIESATRIYGAMMDVLWGTFEPIPENQLVILEGGETLNIAGLEIRALYTPGHAIHHLAYFVDESVFSGDIGGVRLQGANHVVAPTPPPDIDFEAWRSSIQTLRDLGAKRILVSHYGEFNDVANHLNNLEINLNALEKLSLEVMRSGGGRDEIAERIENVLVESVSSDAWLVSRYTLATPHLMAADGLVRYWQRKRPEALLSSDTK
jgi:glyoxylase-like metal-dependent hydrolase (beta-lactamase superfamily II)